MKRVLTLLLVLISIIIFVGCSTFKLRVSNIKSKTLIEGQWIIQKNADIINEDNVEGSVFSFGKDEVLIDGKLYENIGYKAKVVSGEEYLYDVIGYIPQGINVAGKDIKVLTISSNYTYLKDIIFIEEKVYIIGNSSLYELVKVDNIPMMELTTANYDKNHESYHKLDSGVLIGLRQQSEEGPTYRTLWINVSNGEINVEELPYLLLPRKNGFYKVSNKRVYNDENYHKDIIVFEDMNGRTIEFQNDITNEEVESANITRGITFIGNDYMSTKTYLKSEEYEEEWLSTYVLDLNTLGLNQPIPLSTLTDSTEMSNVIMASDMNKELNNKDINSFTNFAIRRKQGRWSFYTLAPKKSEEIQSKTLLNTEGKELGRSFESQYEKVDIALRVSKKIARHDEIFIPWQGIQKQVPSALDAFSSPNKSLAVIKTKAKLYIYKTENNSLNLDSEVVVPLQSKESIVMGEWAEGDYVGYWTEYIKSLK